MNTALRIALAVGLLFYFICIISLLRKKKLDLKYTLLWLLMGVIMALVLIFPSAFGFLMGLIGIAETVNGVFAVIIFALLIILVSLTSIVSKLNQGLRQLTQKCAIYEKRIRDLEEKNQDDK